MKKLPQRVSTLRNEHGLIDVQLADILGYSQQKVLSLNKGRRRLPVSALPEVSRVVGVSVEELPGTADEQPAKGGPAPTLPREFEQLSQLPRSQQRFVFQMLDAVLQQVEQ